MDRSAGPQQPLEITPGMRIAIAVILVIGYGSSMADRNGRNEDEIIGLFRRPVIVRKSGQPIRFPQLGVIVTPTGGWSHLSSDNRAANNEPTFINASLHAIAKLKPFPFQSWPPTDDAVLTPALDDAEEDDTRLARAVIASESYTHVNIQWLQLDRQSNVEPGFQYGRVIDDSIDLLITVMKVDYDRTSEDPIATFCNSIRPIEQP